MPNAEQTQLLRNSILRVVGIFRRGITARSVTTSVNAAAFDEVTVEDVERELGALQTLGFVKEGESAVAAGFTSWVLTAEGLKHAERHNLSQK